MASVLVELSSVKSNRCFNPSGKVRLIGKIKGLMDGESDSLSQNSKPWITFKNPEYSSSEKCKIFFDTQSTSRKDGCELDYCYGQHEEIGQIYSQEIQPIVLDVFSGRNASIIALGARGSGKTCTIQGSLEKPGLAVIAMNEILSKAKELGKSVSVSLYELTQELVKDLLNPDHPVIQVLEDAQGKIKIKGLSQVPMKSIKDFHSVYFTQGSFQNTQKIPTDQPHRGLMVHIWSDNDRATLPVKINFVDLAGYQDIRSGRDGNTPAESIRKNKSLYALLNVVSAINANETRVPYRESKLTRILQDSLGGRSRVLLLTCLNPTFCKDSLSTLSLVSRSFRSTKQVLTDSTNKRQILSEAKELSSFKNEKTVSTSMSVKKQTGHSRLLSTTKASSVMKGRKLFNEVKKINSKQSRCQSEDTSLLKCKTLPSLALIVAPFSLEEAPQHKSVAECCLSNEVDQVEDVNLVEPAQSKPQLGNTLDEEPTTMMKMDVSPHSGIPDFGGIPSINSGAEIQMYFDTASKNEEIGLLHMKDNGSPPLSSRIREICNNLKALCESTPLTINKPEDVVVINDNQLVAYNDILEPKTPAMELKSASYSSPQGNRSSKFKDSLVKDYLNFLNSANKEGLKSLKGIGEKRATYILEMRDESPEPFKTLDDLQDIGLSAKQIKDMMKHVAGARLFD